MKLINLAKAFSANTELVAIGIMAVSLAALASALTAEHVFGLNPCILCLYQRVPYVLTAVIGLAGFILARFGKRQSAAIACIALASLLFFLEAGLAFYHVGVELHWWRSFFEACKVSFDDDSGKSLLEIIQSAPAVRCDEIPWQMFGISMAGYNALLSLGLGITTAFAAFMQARQLRSKP